MFVWRRFHSLPGRVRWPAKVSAAILLTLLVLYPKVWLLPTLVRRVFDLESLLQPGHPGLALLEEHVRQRLNDPSPRAALTAVQQVVYEDLPYSWDWETWGVVEYLPTVDEVLKQGREDCDGRAVVAASLLRRMGHDAWLVTDLLHMWVETPAGETMSPTGGHKTLASGRATEADAPSRWDVSIGVVQNLARGFSFGVAVFPLPREAVLLVGFCLIALQPRSSLRRRVSGIVLMAVALGLLRAAGRSAAMTGQSWAVAASGIGFALAAGGWLLLVIRGRDRRPRFDAAPAG